MLSTSPGQGDLSARRLGISQAASQPVSLSAKRRDSQADNPRCAMTEVRDFRALKVWRRSHRLTLAVLKRYKHVPSGSNVWVDRPAAPLRHFDPGQYRRRVCQEWECGACPLRAHRNGLRQRARLPFAVSSRPRLLRSRDNRLAAFHACLLYVPSSRSLVS